MKQYFLIPFFSFERIDDRHWFFRNFFPKHASSFKYEKQKCAQYYTFHRSHLLLVLKQQNAQENYFCWKASPGVQAARKKKTELKNIDLIKSYSKITTTHFSRCISGWENHWKVFSASNRISVACKYSILIKNKRFWVLIFLLDRKTPNAMFCAGSAFLSALLEQYEKQNLKIDDMWISQFHKWCSCKKLLQLSLSNLMHLFTYTFR